MPDYGPSTYGNFLCQAVTVSNFTVVEVVDGTRTATPGFEPLRDRRLLAAQRP